MQSNTFISHFWYVNLTNDLHCLIIYILTNKGLNTGLFIPLLFGSDVIFPFFFPETVSTMKAIQSLECRTMRGTPTQFIDIINHPERKNMNFRIFEWKIKEY